MKKYFLLTTLMFIAVFSMACSMAETMIDRLPTDALASLNDETPTATRERPTPRPTFTPTSTPTDTATPTPTFTATPVPTDTPVPTNTPEPTNTPAPTNTPEASATPVPTNTPKPPPPQAPTDTPTPSPPTATPPPNYSFKVREQGDRSWQKTNNSQITNIVLISDGNSTPLGGYSVMGEHSSGRTYKSGESSWAYNTANALSGYVKQGNLKVEPGGYEDGIWYFWVVDGGGTQVSDKVALEYYSNPEARAWDFIWWAN